MVDIDEIQSEPKENKEENTDKNQEERQEKDEDARLCITDLKV
jgi:hypothetical protein